MLALTAVAKTTLYYLPGTPAPADQAALTELARAFLAEVGGAVTAPMDGTAGGIELHCGPVRLVLSRTEGAEIEAAQRRLWGRDTPLARIEREAAVAVQIAVEVAAGDAGEPAADMAAPLLAGISVALARTACPDALQWLKPASWTTGAQFLAVLDDDVAGAAPRIRPHRPSGPVTHRHARPAPAVGFDALVRAAQPAAGALPMRDSASVSALRARLARQALIEPTEVPAEAEAARISTAERLATWSFSLSLATVSLPVASSLAVYNLLRGEDLRRSAHVVALTGFMLTLGSSGAFAQVASVLGI